MSVFRNQTLQSWHRLVMYPLGHVVVVTRVVFTSRQIQRFVLTIARPGDGPYVRCNLFEHIY